MSRYPAVLQKAMDILHYHGREDVERALGVLWDEQREQLRLATAGKCGGTGRMPEPDAAELRWMRDWQETTAKPGGEPSMVDDETCERCCHGTGRHTCQRAMRIEPSEAMIEALHAVLDSGTCGCNKGQYIMRGLRERVRAALAAGSSK